MTESSKWRTITLTVTENIKSHKRGPPKVASFTFTGDQQNLAPPAHYFRPVIEIGYPFGSMRPGGTIP